MGRKKDYGKFLHWREQMLPLDGVGLGEPEIVSQRNQFRGIEVKRGEEPRQGEGRNQPGKTHSQKTPNSRILREVGKITRWPPLGARPVEGRRAWDDVSRGKMKPSDKS